jgi:acetoin utilization deacetylase AcuC-like enzyme
VAAVAGVRDAAGAHLAEIEPEPVAEELLTAVHDRAHLAFLDDAEARGGGWIDPDTYLVAGSMRVARTAAGATVAAARAVARGDAVVAFAAVRPPGHHAAARRASGFCLVNNVAVAVAALRADGLRRVAVVDWDVHHGDGTQELLGADPDLLYASTHQSPFYPGTGWPHERGVGPAAGSMLNRPLAAGEGDEAFIATWRDDLVPAIERFAPNAILVSAGYDAHAADPLAELTVTEAGYEAAARALGAASARLGLAGVALTLEGGYDLEALRASVAATVRGILAGRAEGA